MKVVDTFLRLLPASCCHTMYKTAQYRALLLLYVAEDVCAPI